MVTIKGKSILLCLVIVSLIFAVPAVQSFSFSDLSDMVGYVLFNSFLVVTGMAGGVDTVCTGLGGTCVGGSTCPDGYEVAYSDCNEEDDDEVVLSGEDGGKTAMVIADITGKIAGSVCCVPIPPSECGDGTCDEDETCGSCIEDCLEVVGPPACASGEFCDYEGCGAEVFVSVCGDGTIDEDETCDKGSDVESISDDVFDVTCADYDYDGGDLACSSDCQTISTSGCNPIGEEPYCEDGFCNGDETCSSCSSDCGTCDDPHPGYVYSCAAINGICTDSCGQTFMHYTLHDKYDEDCEDDHGAGFMCCLPSYVVSESGEILDEEDWTEDEEGEGEYEGSVKNVEDYMIDKQEAAKSAQSYLFEGGLTGVLSSLSYAMGGIWVIFVLTVVVVMITYYLHKKSVGGRKKKTVV